MNKQDHEEAVTELREIITREVAPAGRLSPRIQHLRQEAQSRNGEELGEGTIRSRSLTSKIELKSAVRPLLNRFLHRYNSSSSLKQ